MLVVTDSIQLVQRIPCTREFVMDKAAFNKNETFFTRKFNLCLTKNQVKCYIWSLTLYGVKTCTLLKVLRCVVGEVWRRSVGAMM
jgi:hypothetical protein